jgi:3' exoribonuclease, RNase T-like
MAFRNFMLDIETLGIASNSIVLSIAIVEFDKTGPIGEPFYRALDSREQLNSKRTMSLDTIEWWMDFGASYPKHHRVKVFDALIDMVGYLPEEHLLWAMPPSFDLRILEDLFRQRNVGIPWSRHNVRDVYTIADALTKEERDKIREENTEVHNAIADCKNQIKLVTESWRKMGV